MTRALPKAFLALALAAHFAQVAAVEWLLDHGAGVDCVAQNQLAVTPLHAALFGRRSEAALLLIERGADMDAARGGAGFPRAGWTPLHYAAALGLQSVIGPLLQKGAAVERQDANGQTPIEAATEAGEHTIAARLTQQATL